MIPRRSPSRVHVLALTAFLLLMQAPAPARGAIHIDPKEPFTWKDLLDCELVVVARYKSHKKSKLELKQSIEKCTLELEVVRVLRGQSCKAGDSITVALEHWYSIETERISYKGWDLEELNGSKEKKPDGFPQLCYKQQFENPGPVRPYKIVPDVCEPEVYFFPAARAPALERHGQVQPRWSADGWQQALDNKPIDVLFRLRQDISASIARAALDELYATRDPAVLDQLFAWLRQPPQVSYESPHPYKATEVLILLGDKKGDVYNRALKMLVEDKDVGKTRSKNEQLFESAAALHQGTNAYWRADLARIMARAAGARAYRDFSSWIDKGPAGLRPLAVRSLGYLRNEKALDRALELLKDPALAEDAVVALSSLFFDSRSDKPRSCRAGRLHERALPRLEAALRAPDIADEVKDQLRKFVGAAEPTLTLDLQRARAVLLDPKELCYNQFAGGEGSEIYWTSRIALDPRFIPLLIQVYREIPAAKTAKSAQFYESLYRYARVFPNELRRHLAKEGLEKELSDYRGYSNDDTIRLGALLWSPCTLEQLREMAWRRGGRAWLATKQVPPKLIQELKETLKSSLSEPDGRFISDLELLLRIDLAEGMIPLRDALAHRGRSKPEDRARLLALALRYGWHDLRGEFLRDVALSSRDEKALAFYLQQLAAAKKVKSYRRMEYVDWPYTGGLDKLFPEHPAPFFDIVLQLLESSSLPERSAGAGALTRALHWDFDFDDRACASMRTEQLHDLRPLLKRLGSLSEMEMRAQVLREWGMELAGTPGRAWLPALRQAALRSDPAVAKNALFLLEEISGAFGCIEFYHFAPALRARALEAFFKDRHEAATAALTEHELQSHWTALAGSDNARAYQAVAALSRSPRQVLPLIKASWRPLSSVDRQRIERLIAELDDDRFAVRQEARKELQALGELAEPALRRVLAGRPSLEVNRSIDALLELLHGGAPSPERLRTWRVLELLEIIGTTAARQLLEPLARGDPDARLTGEAKAALERWQMRFLD